VVVSVKLLTGGLKLEVNKRLLLTGGLKMKLLTGGLKLEVNKRKKLLTGGLKLEVNKRLVKTLVWSVAMYG